MELEARQSMRFAKILLYLIIVLGSCLPEQLTSAQTPLDKSPVAVVTIDPACPVEPSLPVKPGERRTTVPVRVRYDPAAPGAKLTSPESLTLSLAINASYYVNNHRTFVMSRTPNGAWETTIPLEASWSFLIFFVQDQNDRVDSNQGDYWQILSCGADGTPTSLATYYLAASYAGDVLAPGIQRAVVLSSRHLDPRRGHEAPSRQGRIGVRRLALSNQAGRGNRRGIHETGR